MKSDPTPTPTTPPRSTETSGGGHRRRVLRASVFDTHFLKTLEEQGQIFSKRDEIDLKDLMTSADLFSAVTVSEFPINLAGFEDTHWENNTSTIVGVLHLDRLDSFFTALKLISQISLFCHDLVMEKMNEDDILIIADLSI